MQIFKIKLIVIAVGLLVYGLFFFGDKNSIAEMVPLSIVSMAKKGDIALIVEKATQTLSLYRFDGKFKLESKMNCSTGKSSGRKNKSGDKKTPEGVYFFTGRYLKKDLSPVYGSGAFPVDYPNQIDKEVGRTGYSIWLHGTDRELKPQDSNGCVALENQNIEKIQGRISLDYTPIVFLDRIEYIDANQNTGDAAEINSLLEEWAGSLGKGTYHQYLSHYSPDYFPDIGWWNKWKKLRNNAEHMFSVKLKQKSIYRDGPLYVVLLEEKICYGEEEKRIGVKKLYVSKEKNDYKIRGESYKVIHHAVDNLKKKTQKKSRFMAAAYEVFDASALKKTEEINSHVKGLVARWIKDWSAGKIDDYAKFYSGEFYASGMDKTAWVDRKRYLNKIYNYIDVTISKLSMKHEKERIYVSFQQHYKSSGYSAEGSKTLVLVSEDKRWKIIQEIWKKN